MMNDNNNNEDTTMITLADGQQIKTTRHDIYEPVIRVCVTIDEGEGDRDIERALGYNHALVSSYSMDAMITADYHGKAEKIALDSLNYAAATLVRQGDIVTVNGKLYSVTVIERDFCDRIHFAPLVPECTDEQRKQYALDNYNERCALGLR